MADIDFEKQGVPSKLVPPPKESDESIEKRDQKRASTRDAEIKKSAAELDLKRVDQSIRNLQELVRRGGAGGGGGVGAVRGGGRPGVSPASDNLLKQAKGGIVRSASKRADGIAQRGKTRGKLR